MEESINPNKDFWTLEKNIFLDKLKKIGYDITKEEKLLMNKFITRILKFTDNIPASFILSVHIPSFDNYYFYSNVSNIEKVERILSYGFQFNTKVSINMDDGSYFLPIDFIVKEDLFNILYDDQYWFFKFPRFCGNVDEIHFDNGEITKLLDRGFSLLTKVLVSITQEEIDKLFIYYEQYEC